MANRQPRSGPRGPRRTALAFDLYGTLVDPIKISSHLARRLPEQAIRIAEVWRQKQLEYSFRLTAMERYEDFEQITGKALDFALAATGQTLSEAEKGALMAEYDGLERFEDVEPGLTRLHSVGCRMVVFSNGTPRMIAATIEHAELGRFFEALLSVDEVKAYKPAPRVYRHLAARLALPTEEIWLVSSNPFDVVGAGGVGMPTAWVRRATGPFDTLGDPPTVTVTSLLELARRFESEAML